MSYRYTHEDRAGAFLFRYVPREGTYMSNYTRRLLQDHLETIFDQVSRAAIARARRGRGKKS